MVQLFKKKPVVIRAIQWTGENREDIRMFMNTQAFLILEEKTLIIPTLEGDMEASLGDYIIQGVKGEFYPCKPDIFEMTYEAVIDEVYPEEVKLTNGLITQKYTYIEHEKDFKFNAPHHFKVKRVKDNAVLAKINFQEGAIGVAGVNGVMGEDLIAMVIRRLQEFQATPFNCRENAMAITKLEESLMWLRKRTMDREARNVEGTHIV